MLTTLAQETTITKSDILPVVDISVKTLKNPNEHIFATRNHHEKRFDYQKIKFGNDSQQPVLFEHMTEIHLTRSKYVITSYLNFDQCYKGPSQLEDFANKLLLEFTKLSKTEMPYFSRRYSDKQTVLEDIFKTHKQEVMHLIQTLEAHKYQFNKILDHMTTSTDINHDKSLDELNKGQFINFYLDQEVTIVKP